jgi:hypothetical protein
MAQRRKPSKKKTSFVPRVVFATAMAGAGVIPLCVTACGGNIAHQGQGNAGDSGFGVADTGFRDGVAVDSFVTGVADSGFSVAADAFTVADTGFSGGVATDAFTVADSGFGVADTGFTVAMVGFEGGDAPFGVADTGFHGEAGAEGGEPVDGGEG